MTPSGRCVQDVKANGLVFAFQISQYWAAGRTLTFTLTPIFFHIPAITVTAFDSQSGSLMQLISVSKPSGLPASARSFLAPSMSCFINDSLAYSGWIGQTW